MKRRSAAVTDAVATQVNPDDISAATAPASTPGIATTTVEVAATSLDVLAVGGMAVTRFV
jgi:hypothetical protein